MIQEFTSNTQLNIFSAEEKDTESTAIIREKW